MRPERRRWSPTFRSACSLLRFALGAGCGHLLFTVPWRACFLRSSLSAGSGYPLFGLPRRAHFLMHALSAGPGDPLFGVPRRAHLVRCALNAAWSSTFRSASASSLFEIRPERRPWYWSPTFWSASDSELTCLDMS